MFEICDRYADRMADLRKLISKVKTDIKELYLEYGVKGYIDVREYGGFNGVKVENDVLFIRDKGGVDWHIDNIDDLYLLLYILHEMYHFIPED